MSSPQSVTEWIQQLPQRNQDAVQKLWAIYFPAFGERKLARIRAAWEKEIRP